MASKSYQRSKEELEKHGYVVGKTEQPWNQFSKVRKDFCGFADLIAFHPDKNDVLAVQCCSDNGGDVSAHVKKLTALDSVRKWIKQPCRRLEIWGWGKRGVRGKRKMWTLRVIEINIVDGDSIVVSPCLTTDDDDIKIEPNDEETPEEVIF